MATVSMFLPSMSGTTGNTLWLYKSSDFSLVNTGGDALTESGTSGWFTADVAESWTETLAATVLDTNSLASGYGWLAVGSTQIVDATAVLDSAVQDQLDAILEAAGAGGTDWTDEERAEIRYRLGLTGTATAPAGSTPDPIVINPPDDEDQTTGYTITRDSSLARLPAVTVRVMMIESPANESGQFYSDGVQSIVSDDNAIAQMPLRKGATYLVWSGSQKNAITVAVPADAADTFALPSIVGRF